MSFAEASLEASELLLLLSSSCSLLSNSDNNVYKKKMVKLFIVLTLAILAVDSAPQLSDVELKEQAFNRINEAEYDYK